MSRSLALALLGLAALALPARAEDRLPARVQAVLAKKVLKYDKELRDAGAPRIVVVHDGATAAEAAELVASFAEIDLRAEAHPGEELPALDARTVVYVVSPGLTPGAQERCAAAGALTITAHLPLVQAGRVSIGLGTRADGRPEIVIHLGRLAGERHELSSQLLTLARIVR